MSYRTGLSTALALCALVVLQNAWLCDDAFITFRTADNFLNGHGLTWNAGERVQAFTNPLWLLAVSLCYFISGEIYYTAIVMGAAVSVLAVYFALPPSDGRAALIGGVFLASSKAFVDFSTSGLENPLSFLLLALFIRTYIEQPHNVFRLALLAGLATFNRMDTALLYLPALLSAWWPQRDLRATAAAALGFAPFGLWEAFAIVYYGFPFPNTAYAKLTAGIPAGEIVTQGLRYAGHSFKFDPLTLCTIAGALGLVLWRRDKTLAPLAGGLALYLLYVVRIGGDFMSGRFYAVPYLLAVALLVRAMPHPAGRSWIAVPALTVALALMAPHPTFLSGPNYGADYVNNDSIAKEITEQYSVGDERAFYYPYTGLLKAVTTHQDTTFPIHGWADWGRRLRHFADGGKSAVVTWPLVGFIGFYGGPDCYFIDMYGLGDPLTARLPARRDVKWGIGHMERILPDGYFETHLYGPNLITDPRLARYYAALKSVIAGDLFSSGRLAAIWNMNTGGYDHLIDHDKFRYPEPEDVLRSQRATMGAPGHPPITFRPDRFMHYNGLGDLYYDRAQYLEAAQTYRRALDIDDNYIRRHHPKDHREKTGALYLQLARSLDALDQPDASRAVLETYLRRYPQNEAVWDSLNARPSPPTRNRP